MILVDVYMPAIDMTCDFWLDESVVVEKIIVEVAEMIIKKTKSGPGNGSGCFMLYSTGDERALDRNLTLQENRIRDGSRLILV